MAELDAIFCVADVHLVLLEQLVLWGKLWLQACDRLLCLFCYSFGTWLKGLISELAEMACFRDVVWRFGSQSNPDVSISTSGYTV